MVQRGSGGFDVFVIYRYSGNLRTAPRAFLNGGAFDFVVIYLGNKVRVIYRCSGNRIAPFKMLEKRKKQQQH